MKLKYKKVLAIDFGTKNIKIVEGSFKKGRLKISNKILIELPNGIYEDGYIKDTETLKEILDSSLNLNNIKRRDTIAVINSSEILTRNIYFPSVNSSEIAGMIKYKISDYIPIDLEDYVIQYINQGNFVEDGNEKVKLFVIAMPKKMIEIHFNLLKSLGLKPKILDFQGNSINKFITFTKTDKSGTNIERNNISNIDIGFFSTKLTILKNRSIEVSRIIPLGIKDILKNINIDSTENEILETMVTMKKLHKGTCQISIALNNFLINLFESLDMVFKYYNSLEIDNNIDLILLQGGITKLGIIANKFEEYFNVKTLSINTLDENTNKELYLYSNAIGSFIRGDS